VLRLSLSGESCGALEEHGSLADTGEMCRSRTLKK